MLSEAKSRAYQESCRGRRCEDPRKYRAVIDVYVERVDDDDIDLGADYLVEPLDGFRERYQLVMGSTLVDINSATTCRIRVLNPFSDEICLRQDAEIASAERIERIVTVVSVEENTTEANNLNNIRRVGIGTARQSTASVRIKHVLSEQLPDHLKELHERSTHGKAEHTKQVVAGLLNKYSDTFSRDDWDIGLTHLAEHPINTGDANPVKQRPRRVPLHTPAKKRRP